MYFTTLTWKFYILYVYIFTFFVLCSWQEAVEICYSLRVSEPPSLERYEDKEAVHQLSSPPPKWCLEADEELAKFIVEHGINHEASLGNISRYVESVQVSSVSYTCICTLYITCAILIKQ